MAAATVYLPQGAGEPESGRETMTRISSNRIRALAVGAAITCVLGGGATAVLLPSFAAASQGADDGVRHVRHSADDAVAKATPSPSATPGASATPKAVAKKSAAVAKPKAAATHGSDGGAGHLRHGADDAPGHVRHSSDDATGHVRQSSDDGVGHVRGGASGDGKGGKHGGNHDGPNHT
jgi:hypothetical protein